MHWAIRLRNKLMQIEQFICAVAMFILVCTVFWGVLERYVFKMGSGYPDEMARYLCIWAMMIGSGLCAARGAHIGVEAFVQMLPKHLHRPMAYLSHSLCCVFTITLACVGFQYFGRLLRSMQLTPTIEFPIAYCYLAIPIGGVLMTIHYLIKIVALDEESKGA